MLVPRLSVRDLKEGNVGGSGVISSSRRSGKLSKLWGGSNDGLLTYY